MALYIEHNICLLKALPIVYRNCNKNINLGVRKGTYNQRLECKISLHCGKLLVYISDRISRLCRYIGGIRLVYITYLIRRYENRAGKPRYNNVSRLKKGGVLINV